MIKYDLENLQKNLKPAKIFNDLKSFGYIQNRIELKSQDDKFNKCEIHFRSLKDEKSFKDYCLSNNIKVLKKDNQNIPKLKGNENTRSSSKFNSNKTDIANPSFYFYKDKAYGERIEDYQLKNNYKDLFTISNTKNFDLTTTYPGLLVGSGYNHPKLKEKEDGTKNNEDFQLGFFFDYTTGLPLISGSSIKGVLKSVCKNIDFMEEVYGKTIPLDIFEDNQTIFYDAFITDTKNKDKKIFGSDYITSHYSDEPNGEFKNPNPIKFLKILPNVTFKFQFKCDEKYLDIFKAIILDFGLGAKTNTGYGKFIEGK